jgi:hypothetical protein
MYKFQIRLNITTSSFIGIEEEEYHIELSSGIYSIKSLTGKIKDSKELFLTKGGFNTEAEALNAGHNALDALRWCSAKLGIGLDLGDNKIKGGVTDAYREQYLKETGIRLVNGVNGLMVIEDSKNVKSVFASASAVVTRGRESFLSEFNYFLSKEKVITVQTALAFHFFNLAQQFETSLRVKFLLNIIALESLVEQKERREEATSHVDQLIQLTENNSNLNSDEKNSMISTLKHLRNESISASVKNFIGNILEGKRYGNKSVRKFFTDCYEIRSEFVHDGKWDDEKERLVYELERMVVDLLLTLVEIGQ